MYYIKLLMLNWFIFVLKKIFFFMKKLCPRWRLYTNTKSVKQYLWNNFEQVIQIIIMLCNCEKTTWILTMYLQCLMKITIFSMQNIYHMNTYNLIWTMNESAMFFRLGNNKCNLSCGSVLTLFGSDFSTHFYDSSNF